MSSARHRLSIALSALALVASLGAVASRSLAQTVEQDETKILGSHDPKAVERLNRLSKELRCLVCQNQTLADSQAALAQDLRNEVFEQIEKGKTDQQIKDYLVDRYGDFVLYRPPVQSNTVLLWFGPFALLGVGAITWVVVQRRSRKARQEQASADEAARQRARELLEEGPR